MSEVENRMVSLTGEVEELMNTYAKLFVKLSELEQTYKMFKDNLCNIIGEVLRENKIKNNRVITISTEDVNFKIYIKKPPKISVTLNCKISELFEKYGIPKEVMRIIGRKKNIIHAIALTNNLNEIKHKLKEISNRLCQKNDEIEKAISTIETILSFTDVARNIKGV